jgi:conjugal transfer pilus assembly protein TraU
LRAKKTLLSSIAFMVLILTLWGGAFAVCSNQVMNPISDVCWSCIFPIKVSGMTIVGGGGETSETPDPANNLFCTCPISIPPYIRIGIPISFWEPARFIETVKDPYCFPSLGLEIGGGGGFLRGSHEIQHAGSVETSMFAQAHYFVFVPWVFMELLTDFICLESSGFDLAYITEVDPMWQDDLLTYQITPEAALFANMAAQMACVADSVASNLNYPLSPLFWCMGSWGSAYPLTGHVNDDDYVQANAAIAARMIYKLSRELLVCDTGVNLCSCVPTPIWVKHNYRMHVMKPVRDFGCHPIGRTGIAWEYAKNPPFSAGSNASDNFVWMLFRKRACCAF